MDVKKVTIYLSDELMAQLSDKAGSVKKVPLLIKELIKQDINYESNLEQNNFVGKLISGESIISNNDTVVLGGSNYVYQVVNAAKVNKNRFYKVIDFLKGQIILKQLRKGNR